MNEPLFSSDGEVDPISRVEQWPARGMQWDTKTKLASDNISANGWHGSEQSGLLSMVPADSADHHKTSNSTISLQLSKSTIASGHGAQPGGKLNCENVSLCVASAIPRKPDSNSRSLFRTERIPDMPITGVGAAPVAEARELISQGGETVSRQAHNLKTACSTHAPATTDRVLSIGGLFWFVMAVGTFVYGAGYLIWEWFHQQ